MLKLTQLTGFAAGGGTVDATPDPIAFDDISDAGVTASATTTLVTISGIDTTITLRLTLTASMSASQIVDVYRDGGFVTQGASGTTVDVAMTNGQTLQYNFTNALDGTSWTGTATVTNVSDGNAVLDTFAFTLIDTGSGGVGVGGVGVSEGPPP
jgi:hypothetical protein